jgi:hypothetical protein
MLVGQISVSPIIFRKRYNRGKGDFSVFELKRYHVMSEVKLSFGTSCSVG